MLEPSLVVVVQLWSFSSCLVSTAISCSIKLIWMILQHQLCFLYTTTGALHHLHCLDCVETSTTENHQLFSGYLSQIQMHFPGIFPVLLTSSRLTTSWELTPWHCIGFFPFSQFIIRAKLDKMFFYFSSGPSLLSIWLIPLDVWLEKSPCLWLRGPG
jgi:hypothetical protein